MDFLHIILWPALIAASGCETTVMLAVAVLIAIEDLR